MPQQLPAYESTGRAGQKGRTRAGLLAAMRRLIAEGSDPSVSDVARAAGISRTTAYRYFPDQGALLRAAMPEAAVETLLAEDAPADVRQRLHLVLDAHFRFIAEWETHLRAALRHSLQPPREQPLLRGGRAIGWYEQALAPLRTERPELDRHQLAVRLRAAAGIEPYVWLVDVAGLTPRAAFAALRANAAAVLDAALVAPAPPPRAGASRRTVTESP